MQFYKRSVLVSRFTEETVSKSSSRRSVTLRHVTCRLFASCRTPRESYQQSGSFMPFMRGTKATSSLKQAGSLTKTTLTLRVRGGTGWHDDGATYSTILNQAHPGSTMVCSLARPIDHVVDQLDHALRQVIRIGSRHHVPQMTAISTAPGPERLARVHLRTKR